MDIFETLANFDWVSPVRGLAETILHGPFSGHTF